MPADIAFGDVARSVAERVTTALPVVDDHGQVVGVRPTRPETGMAGVKAVVTIEALPDALDRGAPVRQRVPAAAVRQSVVPAGGAGGQLTPFEQGDRQAPQRQVVGEGGTRATAADDHHPWRHDLLHRRSDDPTLRAALKPMTVLFEELPEGLGD